MVVGMKEQAWAPCERAWEKSVMARIMSVDHTPTPHTRKCSLLALAFAAKRTMLPLMAHNSQSHIHPPDEKRALLLRTSQKSPVKLPGSSG